MATINDIPQPNNCTNCDDLATKLCVIQTMIESIPPLGGGQVPYTDADRCNSMDELPSFQEMSQAIFDVLECFIWQYCNLFCDNVWDCLEADIGRFCGLVTQCVTPFSCTDVDDCLLAKPISNVTSIFGVACDGTIVRNELAPAILPLAISLPPTIVENPYTDPTWTFGGAGPYGNFANKTFNTTVFDISNLPAPCPGYSYYAEVTNNWDFAFQDLGVPTGSWVYGYNGLQTFVNGNGLAGGGGSPLNAGTFIMSPTGGQWAPTNITTGLYKIVHGANTVNTKLIVNKTESPGGNTAQKTHVFTPQSVQIIIHYAKDI